MNLHAQRKSARDAAASKTLRTFLLAGPISGNVIFGFGLATHQVLQSLGIVGAGESVFPLGLTIALGFASAMLYMGVGLVLCWPIGIVPAAIVGYVSAEYLKRSGSVPVLLPCGLASLPTLPFLVLGGGEVYSGSMVFLVLMVVPAFVCWFLARKHWEPEFP